MLITNPNNPDFWPHQFVKNGSGYEIGADEYGIMQFAQTYVCIHCIQEYVKAFEEPAWIHENCPARSTEREMKRLLR